MNAHQKPDDPVKHVVLLLFENHSFDQMLGCFKQVYPDLEGVDAANPGVNRYQGVPFTQQPTFERQMKLDPRHEVNHVAVQMQDHNGGFVEDFIQTNQGTSGKELDKQCKFLMGFYPLDFLPALHRLAHDFLICDHWYSSVPGPTWPNRFFALSGTSCGRVNMPQDGEHTVDIAGWFQQDQPTIFDRLSENEISWKIYFHDIPQSICLMNQRKPENVARYFPFDQFLRDAADPEKHFPAFCFIEPNYNGAAENDDHPPHDIMKAQDLLRDVYNTIRANRELWESTLLVVLYDEHGGFYDHVEPPQAPAPDAHQEEYTFDRFGIRVPAVLVSPWVKRAFDPTAFDHTSLLKYLIGKWGLGPLGDRAAQANDIAPLIQSGNPRQDTVEQLEMTDEQLRPPKPDLEEEAASYISAHHQALAKIGQWLQWEMLRESPVTFAWVFYPLETVLHWLSAFGSRLLFNLSYGRMKSHWQKFHARRREQACTRLAKVIRQPGVAPSKKCFAAETLSGVAGEPFHQAADPVRAATEWLDRKGK